MDRPLFKYPSLTENDIPPFPCPTCNKGILKLVHGSWSHEMTVEAKKARSHPDWDPDWLEYTFAAVLRCNERFCQELVRVAGRGFPDYVEQYDEDGMPFSGLQDSFKPLFFHPSLNVFQPPAKTPKSVVIELRHSYQVFFCDPAAAANHVRSAIERLLTELRVPRFSSGGRRRFLTLQDRISKLPKRYQIHTDLLLAVKWLGNAGSHDGLVKADDVLDAYEITEHFLTELYDSKNTYVRTLAKRINKRRGPRKQVSN
jgi:hypothetical protein